MGRWLGLDIGDKRVGVAVSDESHTLARPLLTVTRASKVEDFARLARVCREQQVDKLIAGLPRTLRNEEGPQARKVRRYAAELSAALGLPVEFCDERFSSLDAAERLAAASRKPRAKGEIDAAAAAIILQDYLNALITPDSDHLPVTG